MAIKLHLTPKEREVAFLMITDLPMTVIAKKLNIGKRRIKTCASRIYWQCSLFGSKPGKRNKFLAMYLQGKVEID